MNTFELSQSRPSQLLDRSQRWDAIARESWDPLVQVTSDDTGRYKVKVNEKGTAVYFKDDTAEWESKDGKNWTRKGSKGTHNFEGSVKVAKDGTITVTNDDTGVKFECLKNGTTTRSITTKDGIAYSITSDKTGKPVSSKVGDKEWLSTDGGESWSRNGGPVWQGTMKIDKFGQYSEKPRGGESTIEARSKEMTKLLDKQAELEKDWGVKFVKPGEKIRYGGSDFESAAPTAKELKTLEIVLYRNQQMNLKNVKFAFAQAGTHTDGTSLWGAYQRREPGGQVVLMPKHSEARGWNALEGTLEHELVHHEQYENWGSNEWGAAGSPEFTKELNSKMGWRYDRANSRYLMSDRDGDEWLRSNGSWVKVVDGEPDPKQKISNDAMHKQAKVRPSTTYFTNPGEMHAEGMAMFRMERQMLFRESPELYQICKSWDQKLINAKWPAAKDGKPTIIRNEKGELVQATKENLAAVQKAEERWRTEQQQLPPKQGDRFFANERGPGGDTDKHASRPQCEHCVQLEIRLRDSERQ